LTTTLESDLTPEPATTKEPGTVRTLEPLKPESVPELKETAVLVREPMASCAPESVSESTAPPVTAALPLWSERSDAATEVAWKSLLTTRKRQNNKKWN